MKCIAKHMINHRISAVWSTTKPIAAFSCTPRVQEVHTKAEVVHPTPGLLGLGVLFNCPQRPVSVNVSTSQCGTARGLPYQRVQIYFSAF